MKRMLGIFMALLLFVAPAIAQGATVEGDWELVSAVLGGTAYEDLAQLGMTMTMRLEAGGTGVQTVNGENYPCTWVESDGKILIDDGNGSLPYTLQPDGTLLGQDESGDSMTFARRRRRRRRQQRRRRRIPPQAHGSWSEPKPTASSSPIRAHWAFRSICSSTRTAPAC